MPLLVTQSIIQQVSGTSTFDYGFSTTNITTNSGSMLVVLAGWNLSTTGTTAFMPAVYVTDSAGNVWNHVATSSANVTGSRSAAWVCVNSRPVSWISVSLSTFASSLAYDIIEIANGPKFFSIDVIDNNSSDTATGLKIAPGNTQVDGIAFSVFTVGAVISPNNWPSGWAGLTPVTSGASSVNPVQIFPFWAQLSAGTSANTTYNLAKGVPVSGITFSVELNPPSPVQPNSQFPLVSVQAAFGFVPGDPSQAPPVWTDISNRVAGGQGSSFITTSAGRQYELSTPEAGELNINLDNHDGAFTPGNTNSPYFPNVVLGTPIRVQAFWSGSWYNIAYGYIERWPQEWPDLPQWGMSNLVAVDAVGVLSNITMPSALDGDILMDNPYIFIPANEQYSRFINGLDSTFTSTESQGLLAANASRINQRAAMYVDGSAAIAEVGQATSILGDNDSGFGTDAISVAPTTPVSGPGIIYTDVNIPDVIDPGSVTVEFWVIIPATVPAATLQPTVFQAFGYPSNYAGNNPSLSVKINNLIGSSTLTVTLADGATINAPFNVNISAQMITLLISSSSLSIYVNGALETSTVLNAGQTTHWNALALGCCNYAYESGALSTGNFTAFDFAVYPYLLSTQRIVSHFSTGSSGQENSDATARIAQILDWGKIGIARGGQVLFNGIPDGVLQGPAYSLVGTNAMDGINQVASNHTAMVAAMADGALVFTHRWGLFNKLAVAVLGDSNDPHDGQIPSTQATGFGFDNTFLYNTDQITQQNGPTSSITVIANDFTSQHEFFVRSAPARSIATMSLLDVYDVANWEIAKYSQPAFRISQITLDASANPSIFTALLTIKQGDVVSVIRNPLGGAPINIITMVQKVSHVIGPHTWQTTYQLSPYAIESAVLELGTPIFNTLGSNTLA